LQVGNGGSGPLSVFLREVDRRLRQTGTENVFYIKETNEDEGVYLLTHYGRLSMEVVETHVHNLMNGYYWDSKTVPITNLKGEPVRMSSREPLTKELFPDACKYDISNLRDSMEMLKNSLGSKLYLDIEEQVPTDATGPTYLKAILDVMAVGTGAEVVRALVDQL